MKYFEIYSSIKVDGIVTSGLDGRNVRNKDFFKNKFGPNTFFEENYEFDYLVPHEFGDGNENKPTHKIYDFHTWLGESPIGGWLKPVSKKFKDLLMNYNLGSHKFYPAWVAFQDKKLEYFVLQIFYDEYQRYLDFDNTVFNNLDSSRALDDQEFQKKRFGSINEMESFSEEHWNWDYNYERIVMTPEFKKVDFTTIYLFGDIVSERLKKAIEKAGLTGIEFRELQIPIEFSDDL